MYTTVAKVRAVSGFTGNSNVSDSFIASLIIRAESYIRSFISDAYALPLGKYYQQTIVFSGTGSGANTLTITIDGASYAVTTASSLTAAQAADRFRTAAEDSDSFITDGLGNGATVTLWSKGAGDSGEVTITSTDPQTVSGITATGGTVTETAPPLVEMLATEIAGAYLLMVDYGPESQDTTKEGQSRLALCTTTLEAIRDKKEKLFDFQGNELANSSTKSLSFYPTTASDDPEAVDSTGNRFTMTKKF